MLINTNYNLLINVARVYETIIIFNTFYNSVASIYWMGIMIGVTFYEVAIKLRMYQ
jgi:hypothetical protein